MAGNVKEWCWNETIGGRMILGGGWNEPSYMYDDRDAQQPFSRLPAYGVRLVKNTTPQPAESYSFIQPRPLTHGAPVDDSAFAILKGSYSYDAKPLNVKIEGSEDDPYWRKETVTFDAAYGGERVTAYVYLPKSAAPPYQTVVHFPGGEAPFLRSSRDLRLLMTDFVIKSGRALIFPVYKGTYERRVQVRSPNEYRDLTIARGRDFARTLDFIESRADLDRTRIGYYGISMGAYNGVILSALQPRVKASVLVGGGMEAGTMLPEFDIVNFAPRVKVPTLMINGRHDFSYPVESAQLPLFRLLGPPDDQKRHALFEGGHIPNHVNDVIREILDWFDQYLGPIGAPAR
jgi:eukaryotic-like serine/threonine-protein kinase